MINSIDGRPAFEKYCRDPGTRCNWIMSMIEDGLSDKQIAQRVSDSSKFGRNYMQNAGTRANTIAVYRKAYENKLCVIAKMEARPHKVYEALKAEVLKLHADGMKPKQIQDKLKVSKDFVRGVLKHEKS